MFNKITRILNYNLLIFVVSNESSDDFLLAGKTLSGNQTNSSVKRVSERRSRYFVKKKIVFSLCASLPVPCFEM